jgi:hypothetical protein
MPDSQRAERYAAVCTGEFWMGDQANTVVTPASRAPSALTTANRRQVGTSLWETAVLPPSWPGSSRPPPPARAATDGPDEPHRR